MSEAKPASDYSKSIVSSVVSLLTAVTTGATLLTFVKPDNPKIAVGLTVFIAGAAIVHSFLVYFVSNTNLRFRVEDAVQDFKDGDTLEGFTDSAKIMAELFFTRNQWLGKAGTTGNVIPVIPGTNIPGVNIPPVVVTSPVSHDEFNQAVQDIRQTVESATDQVTGTLTSGAEAALEAIRKVDIR